MAHPIVSDRIRPGHDHPIQGVVFHVLQGSGDVFVAECQRVDPLLEEIAPILERAEWPLLGLDGAILELIIAC